MDQEKEVILSLPKRKPELQDRRMKWNKCLNCLDIKSALWEHYKHIWW